MDTTPAPTPPTPWDKKTERLEIALARVNGEIAAVKARHAEKIAFHNEAVETRRHVVDGAAADTDRAYGRLLGVYDNIAALERQLAQAQEDAVAAAAAHVDAETAFGQSETRLQHAQRERDAALDEPNRHLAALEHDKQRLQSRLDLHKARAPRAALFG